RHIAAGLLVPRADHLQLRLVEGVEQAINLRAGQAEHGIDAMRHKAIDDGFSTGRNTHCTFQSVHGVSSTTPLRKMPTPSASTSMTSPGFRYRGGSNRAPAPVGVPVTMTSPGTSVVKVEM